MPPQNRPSETMVHPEVEQIIAQFEATELHAARSGREVMKALGSVVADSSATAFENLELEFESNVDALLRAMPAYAPPINAIHQIYVQFEHAHRSHRSVPQFQTEAAKLVASYQDWSDRARARIAEIGSNVIPRGGVVFTFTLSETVLGTLHEAWSKGIEFRVILTESSPNRDGLMTARSLAERGLDVDISIDGYLGELIPEADVMLVGAEAILSDGSAICKVGTYPCALAARNYGTKVYVLVDSRKFHPNTLFGQEPFLDPISQGDVLNESNVQKADVTGHLFDRTPAEMITAIVTEKGIMHPSQALPWMLEMPISDSIVARLADHNTTVTQEH